MTTLNAISWPLFFGITIGIAILWMLTTRTQIGRTIITEETPWSRQQWERLLLIVVVTIFILVNPIVHLIGIIVLGGLYHVFIGNLSFSANQSSQSKGNDPSGQLWKPKDRQRSIVLSCKSTNDTRPKKAMQALEKCLFSFPFLEDKPTIRHLDETFELEPHLSDTKYISSLVDYIRHAGFQVEQIN